MATVDCQECSNPFSTFKLYIKHLLTKECRGKSSNEEITVLSEIEEPDSKRLKVSPKLFQKKKHQEPDSTTEEDQIIITGEPVFETVQKDSDQNLKKNVVKSQNDSKVKDKKSTYSQSHVSKTSVLPTISKPGAKIPCSVCKKPVKSRGMSQHINYCHKCSYCNATVENVETHISEVHEKEACDHCTKKFETREKVDMHVEAAHLKQCEQCDEEFYTEDSLKAHIVDVHESEECDICNIKLLIADKMMDEHKDKVHGIKSKTIKQFGGMMFMMVSDD